MDAFPVAIFRCGPNINGGYARGAKSKLRSHDLRVFLFRPKFARGVCLAPVLWECGTLQIGVQMASVETDTCTVGLTLMTWREMCSTLRVQPTGQENHSTVLNVVGKY